jgi:nucleoid DNA-binding protein
MQKNNEPEKQKQTPARRNRHSNSFRDRTIRHLHNEEGFSWPKAEGGFRAVFQLIAEVVKSGEPVELPGIGILKSILRKEPAQRRWKPLHNVRTGKKRYKVMPDFRRPRQIVFTPYTALDFTPPPPPPSPEEIEARELAAELLGGPVDAEVMDHLQEGADIHAHRPGAPHGPGTLLRRLRELKKRGLYFQDVTSMAWAVAELYWL